ncbi:LysR family transcriptional regulator [Actinomycetospora atypica]|uniref:LysR family transcriptional regulator n=1 Tax=Actinomycetospora atypica TaxID=1290095 RepID=A0ABV9YKI4_9PSEU
MHDDLGLLIALDVLLDEQSVSGAARRLHLSQPAMSRTLGRLRATTGDEILVRTGGAMIPTPYADRIRGEVKELVARGKAVLTPEVEVDPATLTTRFVLRANDALASAILPALAATMRRSAPSATLSLLGEDSTPSSEPDLDGPLLGGAVPSSSGLRHEVLGTDSLVVHGAGAVADLDTFADAGHVVVSRRGRTRDPIDDALALVGRSRRVTLSVPTVHAAIDIVRGTDLVTTIPSVTARASGLTHAPLPVAVGPVPSVLSWHVRLDHDPAQRWFRRTVAAVVRHALDPPGVRRGRAG